MSKKQAMKPKAKRTRPAMVTMTDFARIVGLGLGEVRMLIKNGVVHRVREHGRMRVDLAEFDRKYRTLNA
jgi:hypothetical protein